MGTKESTQRRAQRVRRQIRKVAGERPRVTGDYDAWTPGN